MPLITRTTEPAELVMPGRADLPSKAGGSGPSPTRGRLRIGLVNNMPDAAFEATERQFKRQLEAASGAMDVSLHLFALDELPRGPTTRRAIAGRYGNLDDLENARLDGLIVTGAEPLTASLKDEVYWRAMTRVIDWAERNTASTIFSCFAAHAAVLYLDGIERRRLPEKRFGLFECVTVAADGLFDGAPSGLRIPHSRWNDLKEGDLRAKGYRIASRSLEAGIDAFTKPFGSLFVFLQGHPEYEIDTLFREYRRDARRYLEGEAAAMPGLPAHYFDQSTEVLMRDFNDRALESRDMTTWDRFPKRWTSRGPLVSLWRASSEALYRNWLRAVLKAAA